MTKYLFVVMIILGTFSMSCARPPHNRPRGRGHRHHTVTRSFGMNKKNLVAATERPVSKNEMNIQIKGQNKIIMGNGIPFHKTGLFPNRGNPHFIKAQSYRYSIPARPKLAGSITKVSFGNFGIALNGVPFDPMAAEFYKGDRERGWQYEALSGAVPLGVDENYAHVQPNGAYHYHGLPTLYLKRMGLHSKKHSPLIGWAADGFPIYALYGYSSSKIKKFKSSFKLKAGLRHWDGPSSDHDGTFVRDYEYVAGLGDLDQCNGRFGTTPEFPKGTYAYFLTENWPVIPRCFKGIPDDSFKRKRRPHPRRRRP